MTASVLQETTSAINNSGSASQSGNAFASNCTIGSTIAAVVGWDGAVVSAAPTVTDSAGQTYTKAWQTYDSTNQQAWAGYYFENNASATKLVLTAAWASNPTFTNIQYAEIGGVTATSFQVATQNVQVDPGGGTNAITTGNVTPTAQPYLAWAVDLDTGYSGPFGMSVGTGWTTGVKVFDGDGTTGIGLTENRRGTSLSAIAGTWTDPSLGGSNPYVSGIMVFTEASSATAISGTSGAVATNTATASLMLAASGGAFAVALNKAIAALAKAASGIVGAVASNPAVAALTKAIAGNVSSVATNQATASLGLAISGLQASKASNQATAALALAASGFSGAVATGAGTPKNAIAVSGGVFSVATLTGTASLNGALVAVGTVGSVATNVGNASLALAAQGLSAAVSTDTGTARLALAIAGGSLAVATLTGSLGNGLQLNASGTQGAVATNLGTLRSAIAAQGVLAAKATSQGTLTASLAIAGVSAARAFAGGTVGLAAQLAGQVGSIATYGGGAGLKIALIGVSESVATFVVLNAPPTPPGMGTNTLISGSVTINLKSGLITGTFRSGND